VLPKFKKIKTKDLYEAAFYIMWGAVFEKVRATPLSERRKARRGQKEEWVVYLSQVPRWAYESWHTGQVYGDITRYAKVRARFKKKVFRSLVAERRCNESRIYGRPR